jgi:nucleotide-binding universal stress UspA family protein
MILIAYDGSDDAKAAVEHIAELVSGQPAVVVTVWEPYVHLVTRYPANSALMAAEDSEEIDDASVRGAKATAEEGAALARTHGLDASSHAVARVGSMADTLLAEGDRTDAGAIVVGSRGLGGFGSLLLGSVSHALLQHADRPVVIVPSPKVAQRRNEHRRTSRDEGA